MIVVEWFIGRFYLIQFSQTYINKWFGLRGGTHISDPQPAILPEWLKMFVKVICSKTKQKGRRCGNVSQIPSDPINIS